MATPSFGPIKALACLILLPLISSLPLEEPPSLLDRHEAQLKRLETLVETLSLTISRLESSLSNPSKPAPATPSAPPLEVNPGPPAVPPGAATWPDWFHLAASLRLDPGATCAAALPFEDPTGAARYFAVGSTRGSLSVLSSAGDAIIDLPPPSDSPAAVTAILSYLPSSRRDSAVLFTGHSDGSIVAHQISGSSLTPGSSQPFIRGPAELNPLPVTGLEVHQLGRTRYIIASDDTGRIRIFTENGNLYGTAIASRKPLAFSKQRLLFLTASGAGSIDLRSMAVRETGCEGLNGSIVGNYAFDASERSKAYGFTDRGDLIHVVILGDASNLRCRARVVNKSEIEQPVSIQAIKGYLVIASQSKICVYNVSSQYYGRVGAPRLLLSANLHEIKPVLSSSPCSSIGVSTAKPLIAADRGKSLLLEFGDGCIGVYRTSFPASKQGSNAMVWGGQALVFFLFLVGVWKFYVKKKDTIGWIPEDSFDSSDGLRDRAIADDGKSVAGVREMRGNRRAPLRKYGPPTSLYPGGLEKPLRPSSGDSGLRGADQGQHFEATGFPERREPLFKNSEVVNDLN